jgi:hypothetical protein
MGSYARLEFHTVVAGFVKTLIEDEFVVTIPGFGEFCYACDRPGPAGIFVTVSVGI